MLRLCSVLVMLWSGLTAGTPAGAQPSPRSTSPPKPLKTPHVATFNNGAAAPRGSADRPMSAAACNARAAAMPGSAGTLGPNGSSQSQTIVAVPIGGGAAAATQQRQIADACARRRH